MSTHKQLKALVLTIIVFSFLVCVSNITKAQSIESNSYQSLTLNESVDPESQNSWIGDYWSDGKYLMTAPGEWNRQAWLKTALVIGTTIVLYNNDHQIQQYFVQNRNQTTDGISGIVKYFGDPVVVVPSLFLIYACNSSIVNDKAKLLGQLGLESVILTNAETILLKLAGHRSRPYTGEGYNSWNGPSLNLSDTSLSFPSMHAATAFALATVASSVYRENKLVAPIAYSIASLTALSRLNDNEHWSSDVFVGAVLGYYTAKSIIERHEGSETHYTIIPCVLKSAPTILVSVKF